MSADCFTHKSSTSRPKWLAIHKESALELLKDYSLTEAEKTDIRHLMAGYCRVLEDAGLIHYASTKRGAIAKACEKWGKQ